MTEFNISGTMTYTDTLGAAFNLPIDDCTSDVMKYLAQYGYGVLMQRASAMTKEEQASLSAQEIADKVYDRRQQRLTDLLAGNTTSTIVRSNVGSLESFRKEVLESVIPKWLAKAGKKMPSGKGSADAFRALCDEFLAIGTNAQKIEAEAQRRKAEFDDMME